MFNNNFENNKEFIKKELEMSKRMHTNKEYLDNFFCFEIPDYVVMALMEDKSYSEFCLFVNASKVNNRITNKEAKQIKYVIGELCHIKSEYDKVSDDFIQELYNNPISASFVEWSIHYHKDEKYDLFKIFNEKEIKIIKQLKIQIQNKIYTEYELDILEMDVLEYYKDEEEDDPEILSYVKELSDVGVSQEDYEKILDKLNQIKK